MDKVRLASPEEVATIAKDADLTIGSQVLKFGEDTAVIRPCIEIDPVLAPNKFRRATFFSHVTTHLRLNGHREVYFNVDASDTAWCDTLTRYGAEKTTAVPQYRFKLVL